jgi:ApbE superfamily uncharacterized protein (UPF0280 family)
MKERMRICIKETEIALTADPKFRSVAERAIREARRIVEEKIRLDPFFGVTYDPYISSKDDPELIRRMCSASISAGVGPMASVAGAVAACVTEKLLDAGCRHAVVDNGGDISLMTECETVVKIYSGNDSTDGVGFIVPSTGGKIVGLCSSSGRIGHSISLGNSDISTVFSDDPVLSDACATALGNMILDRSDLQTAVEVVCGIHGVRGCLAMTDGIVAFCGDLPEFVLLRDKVECP